MTRIIYEYAVLRYVADIEREEFINVGLIMMCKRYKWFMGQFHVNESRITACFPKSNIALLERQLGVFVAPEVPFPQIPVEERYRWLAAVKSAIIQTSPSHPGILLVPENINKENAKQLLDVKFHELFTRLVK